VSAPSGVESGENAGNAGNAGNAELPEFPMPRAQACPFDAPKPAPSWASGSAACWTPSSTSPADWPARAADDPEFVAGAVGELLRYPLIRLDLHRDARRHVTFSFGVPPCLGQPLARRELQDVHGTLYRRVPTLRLATGLDQIPFKHDSFIYGVHELPVA
jgi:hypothetical protein